MTAFRSYESHLSRQQNDFGRGEKMVVVARLEEREEETQSRRCGITEGEEVESVVKRIGL